MKRIKSFLTIIIEHSIFLILKHEDSHGQQLNQRIFSLTMQFAYSRTHCSVRFFICGTAVQFLGAIHYDLASLFCLKIKRNL